MYLQKQLSSGSCWDARFSGGLQQPRASGSNEAGGGQQPRRSCAILASGWPAEPRPGLPVRSQPSPRVAGAAGGVDTADLVMPPPSYGREHNGELSV